MHSQARLVEVDQEWEGPCRRESKVQVFTAIFEEHQQCMRHCRKITSGRSPPVTTEEEWENLKFEIDLITRDRSSLPQMWLSPIMEAGEAIWKDYYSGEKLVESWKKPFWYSSRDYGDRCLGGYTDVPWEKSWDDTWPCVFHLDQSCPCSYPAQPLLR